MVRQLTPKQIRINQHKIAIHLVIVALLNEAEPQWGAMPGEVRREWRRAWDLTLKGF